MKLSSKYTWLWIGWILYFVGVEYMAIKDKKKGDTLSEHWWQISGTFESKPNNWQKGGRVIMAGGMAWLAYHFFPTGIL